MFLIIIQLPADELLDNYDIFAFTPDSKTEKNTTTCKTSFQM